MKKGISGSTLKFIAIFAMLIDHIAAAVIMRLLMQNGLNELNAAEESTVLQWLSENGTLYYVYIIMRMIGRIAFPIFCFLLVEGYLHTHDVKKYALRLGAFALLSEIPFDLAFNSKILEFGYQNVFFTLFFGLLTIIGYHFLEQKTEYNFILRTILQLLVIGAGMGAAYFFKTDYAQNGIICIVVLYLFRKKRNTQITAGCISFLWEPWALLGFLPIAFYNGTRGLKMKYFFYLFYPVHLLLLYGVCCILGINGYAVV